MRVFVGFDGSEEAAAALEEVLRRIRKTGDEVTVAVYSTDESPPTVEEAKATLEAFDASAEIERVDGDPGAQLVELAETGGYDRIVLPGGRTSPLGKIQFDAVTEFVLLNAHTSVTLIR